MATTALATAEPRNLGTHEGADDHQYLTFHLDGERYGLDILKVQEIRDWAPVIVISTMPVALRGILDLRGDIVPVIDLRVWLGLTTPVCEKNNVVIVTRTPGKRGEPAIGLVVDGMPDVLKVKMNEIQPAPDLGSVVKTAFISGLIALETGMTRLLDLDGLLGRVEQLATQILCANDSAQGVACPFTPRLLGD